MMVMDVMDRGVKISPIAGPSSSAESALSLDNKSKSRKRSMESSTSTPTKKPCYSWYYKLESDNSDNADDTESIYSLQAYETERVQDTPDTESSSESDSVVFDVEYEVADATEDDNENACVDSSSGTDDCVMAAAGAAIAAVICDNSIEWLTDGEESDNSSVPESELAPTGFGTCIQCKSKNDNIMFRYCQKCFQERKNLFPPRPKGRRRKRRRAAKEREQSTSKFRLRGNSKNSQDSGILSRVDDLSKEETNVKSGSSLEFPVSSSLDSGIGSSQDYASCDSFPKAIASKRKRASSISSDATETEDDGYIEIKSKRIKGDGGHGFISNSDRLTSSEVSSTTVSKCNDKDRDGQTRVKVNNNAVEVNSEKAFVDSGIIGDNIESQADTKEMLPLKTENSVAKNPLPEHKELCIICNTNTKNSIFLHANIGHMCCCYKCAKHTWITNKKCPVCNGKVKNIVKVFEC